MLPALRLGHLGLQRFIEHPLPPMRFRDWARIHWTKDSNPGGVHTKEKNGRKSDLERGYELRRYG